MTDAILLVNLGSPDSTKVSDVRRYLREFLMDEYVIDSPFLIRWFVVNLLILPSRPKQSAEAYSRIWWESGSPLLEISKQTQAALQNIMDTPIYLAMRYGNPSIASVLSQIKKDGHQEVKLLPLYPHYAMASSKTVIEKVRLENQKTKLSISYLASFYNHPLYIEALATSIKPYLEKNFDKILFSYHGIPERHLSKTDPTGQHCFKVKDCCEIKSKAHETCYRHQVFETTKAVVNRLKLKDSDWTLSFQSRLGKDPWLQPFTDHVLEALPKQGVKRLAVICPAFVADCLETLEEIEMEGKEEFLAAGGSHYEMIPCLNSQAFWIESLKGILFGDGFKT